MTTTPLNFAYDADRDVLTVEGVAYSGDLFRAWAAYGLVVNTPFVITRRRDDGAVTIERLLPADGLSYHDVTVYVDGVAYKPSDNYGLELTCTKTAGWQLWKTNRIGDRPELVGGEYHGTPFCIAVGKVAIVGELPTESFTPKPFGWTGEVSA